MVEKGLYPPSLSLSKPPNMTAPIAPNGQPDLSPGMSRAAEPKPEPRRERDPNSALSREEHRPPLLRPNLSLGMNRQSNLNPLHEQKSVRDLLSYDADLA